MAKRGRRQSGKGGGGFVVRSASLCVCIHSRGVVRNTHRPHCRVAARAATHLEGVRWGAGDVGDQQVTRVDAHSAPEGARGGSRPAGGCLHPQHGGVAVCV